MFIDSVGERVALVAGKEVDSQIAIAPLSEVQVLFLAVEFDDGKPSVHLFPDIVVADSPHGAFLLEGCLRLQHSVAAGAEFSHLPIHSSRQLHIVALQTVEQVVDFSHVIIIVEDSKSRIFKLLLLLRYQLLHAYLLAWICEVGRYLCPQLRQLLVVHLYLDRELFEVVAEAGGSLAEYVCTLPGELTLVVGKLHPLLLQLEGLLGQHYFHGLAAVAEDGVGQGR